MGRSYWYECARCGYRAKVSGGADRGLNFFVQTICCRDCKELYDAVVRLRVPDESGKHLPWKRPNLLEQQRRPKAPPSFHSVLNRLRQGVALDCKWIHFQLQCPVSAIHHVRSWNEPDKCPRCGLYLDKSALPYRLWE